MTKTLGLFFWLLLSSAHALVPIEGIMLGEANEHYQTDPLNYIFQKTSPDTSNAGVVQLKRYHATYLAGRNLAQSCVHYGETTYASPWQSTQAKRSVVSTLQYLGLDMTIKAIGAYAKRLNIEEESFKKLSSNLVKNFCSKNLTVYSLRTVEKALTHYYQNPTDYSIPTISASPFASEEMKLKADSPEARSREFEFAIRNFRALCSWGGDVEDYRLLAPYLKNPFIMANLHNRILGLSHQYNDKSKDVAEVQKDEEAVKVGCEELICRRVSAERFLKLFPMSVGSTGLKTDLEKLYCHHFRYQDYTAKNTIPEIKQWIKEAEIEDPVFETSTYISLTTGVPDLFMGLQSYTELPFLAKSSVDDRWTQWSRQVLSYFSKDLFFEESLRLKVEHRRKKTDLATNGYGLILRVTLGEFDRIMEGEDKVDVNFNLKISKNFLRSMRKRWIERGNEVDVEGQREVKEDFARHVQELLKTKEGLFRQKMWNTEFARLIADELLNQVLSYQGKMFNSYQEEMLPIPLRFSYGVFALSYLHYRANVTGDRLKLNL